MSAKVKTVLKGFDYMRCDDFAKYLENMSAKGWHFKEWGAGLKFEKGEAEQVTYSVEIFTKASEYDMRPRPQTEEFAEYCEAAGWKLVDAKQKFCIFKKVKEDAIPLFTPKERVENAFKGVVSKTTVGLFLLYGLNAFLQWVNLMSFFEDYIFSNSLLYSLAIWNTMFFGQLGVFLCAFVKKWKLIQEIKKGKNIYIGICNDGKIHIHFRDVYVALLVLLMLAYLGMAGRTQLVWMNLFIIVATVSFCAILAKVRPSNNTSVIVQLVFSIMLVTVIVISTITFIADNRDVTEKQKDVPLYLSDYQESGGNIEDISIRENVNLLGSSTYYFIFGINNSIYYDSYQSKYEWILDRIWKETLDKKVNEDMADCTDDWSAKAAFRNKAGTYYVRYENTIFILYEEDDTILTEEQIDIIREKMDLR